MKNYSITEDIKILNERHPIEMERNEPVDAKEDGTAPNTIIVHRSLFEIGRIFGQVLPSVENVDEEETPDLAIRRLQKASDSIAVVRHGYRYRAPLSVVMELLIDSNEALELAKKKQPDTPSSSGTDTQPSATSTASLIPKKKSKSSKDSASAPQEDSASTSLSKTSPAEP